MRCMSACLSAAPVSGMREIRSALPWVASRISSVRETRYTPDFEASLNRCKSLLRVYSRMRLKLR